MSALVLAVTMAYITKGHSIRPVHPLRFICIGDRIWDIYHNDCRFSRHITADMGFPPKNVNKPDHSPPPHPTTIMGLMVRMDAESVASVTAYAEELHVVMAYHCLVSAWMRDHAISTTGCSMMVSPIMGISMGTEDSGLQCTKTRNSKHWSCTSRLSDNLW